MTWPNINFKILTKQHQNINSITKEIKYCFTKYLINIFTYFQKWPKLALGWRWSGRKRTQPCGNHLSNRQGSHVGQFTDFGDHCHLLSRKNLVSSLSNMENMRIKPCNLQNNKFVAMKRKALPQKIHVPNMSHWECKEKGRCVWTQWPWIGWWCPYFVIAFHG